MIPIQKGTGSAFMSYEFSSAILVLNREYVGVGIISSRVINNLIRRRPISRIRIQSSMPSRSRLRQKDLRSDKSRPLFRSKFSNRPMLRNSRRLIIPSNRDMVSRLTVNNRAILNIPNQRRRHRTQRRHTALTRQFRPLSKKLTIERSPGREPLN